MLQERLLAPGTRCFCGCGRLAESLHHLVGKGQRGDDVWENLVPLAGDGTRLCHGALEGAHRTWDDRTGTYCVPELVRRGIGLQLRRPAQWQRLRYVLEKKSAEWLRRRYP